MNKLHIVLLFFLIGVTVKAETPEEYQRILQALNIDKETLPTACDSVISFSGYSVRISCLPDSAPHIGLDLFNPYVKESFDAKTLDFIETALLYQVMGLDLARNSFVDIITGELSDFKNINQESGFNISNFNSRQLSVVWDLDNGKRLEVIVPIKYDNIYGSSRSEIENQFLSKIRRSHLKRHPNLEINPSLLEPYGESSYVLPGLNYLNKAITSNIYLNSDSVPSLIWDAGYPIESISNILIYSSEIGINPDIELTVLKHDYGEEEFLKTNLENFLAVAQSEGCLPYWGMESFDGQNLTGSLFLYNFKHGYDHVLNIKCVPQDVINGTGVIKARMSLFVPSNNVQTLIEPYRIKKEDEKIRYWEN